MPSDPERIYLEPGPPHPWASDVGRQWCEDNVWPTPDSDDEETGVEYVRADRVKRLEEALRECVSDLEMWQASYGLEDTTQAVLLDARAALAENPSEEAG